MLVAIVLEAKIEAGELERGRMAHVVMPFDLGIAHYDFTLPEHPVGEPAVTFLFRFQQDPGHCNASIRVTPHREFQFVHLERMQAQIENQERAPRDHVDHAWQHQRFAPIGIEQAHIDEFQLRAQSAPVGADPLDGHRHADGASHRFDNIGAVPLDVRQHPVAQREKEDGDREEYRPKQHFERAQENARRPDRRMRRAAGQCAAGLNAARVRT